MTGRTHKAGITEWRGMMTAVDDGDERLKGGRKGSADGESGQTGVE